MIPKTTKQQRLFVYLPTTRIVLLQSKILMLETAKILVLFAQKWFFIECNNNKLVLGFLTFILEKDKLFFMCKHVKF